MRTVPDSYWQVSRRGFLTVKHMRAILDKRSYYIAKNASAAKLRDALDRSDRGLLSYDNIKNDELRELLKRRGIDMKHIIRAKRKGQRDELISLLRNEDDNPKFHRFVDLPAEMRNQIYEYHFADYHQPIYAPVQPPITMVSSGIRKETLGLFYHKCTFDFGMTELIEHFDDSPFGRLRFMFDDETRHFMRNTSAVHFSSIQTFRLHERQPNSRLVGYSNLITIGKEGREYEIVHERMHTLFVNKERMHALVAQVRNVVERIVARDGKDRLKKSDLRRLKSAWRKGFAA